MFKGMWKRIYAVQTRTLCVLSLFLLSLTLTFSKYSISLRRLFYAFCDLGKSVAYWFVFVFERFFLRFFGYVPEIEVSVKGMPAFDLQSVLPFSPDVLFYKLSSIGPALLDSDNFRDYNIWLFAKLYNIVFYGSTLLPFALILFVLCKELILSSNGKKIYEKSLGYIFLEELIAVVTPVFRSLKAFFKHLWDSKLCLFFLVLIWVINLNVATIVVEAFAYYYYFVSSFDIFSLGSQGMKLGVDFLVMFFGAPLIFWIIVSYVIFDKLRRRKGYDVLHHNEAKNCGFAKLLNICSLVVGPMGLGKTSFVTDLVLCFVNIFKRQMHDTIYSYDMLFPMFPWEKFEQDIKELRAKGIIYNFPSLDLFVDTMECFCKPTPIPSYIYGYNCEVYPVEKNVGNKIVTVFDAMREYGKAYFVYLNDNPSLSNYPIRFDGKFDGSEFFPRWSGEFFTNAPGERENRFSHILDQDLFRLGIPVEANNPLAGTFSWGIYSVMEFGKSQKNTLEAQDIDKNDEESNQKNDLYEYALKVCRHANVMIDNFVAFRFIADDQRPQSIPAKIRDCFSIVTITGKSELKLALPCFAVENWIYDRVYEPFMKFYYDYRNVRGDRTFTIMILKLFVSLMSNYYKKIYNIFGYFELDVALEAGTAYGEGSPADQAAAVHKYYLAVKKIYSDRYSTDALSGFFSKKQLECDFGMDQYETYAGLDMTVEEMQKQHERYIMELMKIMIGESEPVRATASAPRKTKQTKQNTNFKWDYIK